MTKEIQYCPECDEEMCQNNWFYPGDGYIENEDETYYTCPNCYYFEFECEYINEFGCEDISRN